MELEALEVKKSAIRKRTRAIVLATLKPLAHVLRSWYLNTGYEFLNKRKFSDAEEELIAEISDYYLAAIDDLTNETLFKF